MRKAQQKTVRKGCEIAVNLPGATGATQQPARQRDQFASSGAHRQDRCPRHPRALVQPVSQALNVGQTASFLVVATGAPLYYQWYKDGIKIGGATGSTCSLGLVQTNQAGSYTVVVSNFLGSVTSAAPA